MNRDSARPAMDDETFIERFEAAAIPREGWRHRDHIRAAYLYLRGHPLDEATNRIRASIQKLNAAHQTPETLERGYHETITQAWMRLVHCALYQFGPCDTADAFLDEQSQLLSKRALLMFYSRDRLMSAEAKARFVEPDLAPLPRSPLDGSNRG
jgi:cellobiose-specific phosphotransferase system component IIA